MTSEHQTTKPASRVKFWLLRLLKTVIGGFVTAVLIGIATMFLRDMGLLGDQQTVYVLLSVVAWIGWLVYLVWPIFHRRSA